MKIIVFAILLTAKPLLAASLVWDPSPSPGVTGYKLHYAPAPGVGTNGVAVVFDVGNTNKVKMPELAPGSATWFAVSAYDASGLESELSNEIAWVEPWLRVGAGAPGSLRFEFLRVTENANLKYSIQFCTNLTENVWTEEHPFTPEVTALDGGVEIYKVDVPMSWAPQVFAKVKVLIR